MAKKTWIEKMNSGKQLEIKKVDCNFADIKAGDRMLIATPEIVAQYIRSIPKGKQTSLLQMRKDLAAAYNADITCPVTSGIFLRIVSEAAYEQYATGKSLRSTIPFWRMVSLDSNTAKKLTFGTSFLAEQRKKEKLEG